MSDISKFRAEIDAIDDKLFHLLSERSAIVKKVGAVKEKKQKEHTCFIRSGREADMVRRIYDLFKDSLFPAKAAVQIWRIIINASLSLESKLAITVGPDPNVYWLTREYFGSFLPVSRKKNAQDVIHDVANNVSEVGVLPVSEYRWWLMLPDDIKIFACVPFILQNTDLQIEALAFARLVPEETGDDISLLKIKTEKKLTQDVISTLFGKHSLKGNLLDTVDGHALIEIKGFLSENSPVLIAARQETGFAIALLGVYAAPLTI